MLHACSYTLITHSLLVLNPLVKIYVVPRVKKISPRSFELKNINEIYKDLWTMTCLYYEDASSCFKSNSNS